MMMMTSVLLLESSPILLHMTYIRSNCLSLSSVLRLFYRRRSGLCVMMMALKVNREQKKRELLCVVVFMECAPEPINFFGSIDKESPTISVFPPNTHVYLESYIRYKRASYEVITNYSFFSNTFFAVFVCR